MWIILKTVFDVLPFLWAIRIFFLILVRIIVCIVVSMNSLSLSTWYVNTHIFVSSYVRHTKSTFLHRNVILTERRAWPPCMAPYMRLLQAYSWV